MTRATLDDPNLETAVERALSPYMGLLSPEEMAALRELLVEELSRHPVSARLLKQLAPMPEVQESGEQGSDATSEHAPAAHGGKASR
jgi:hypothetical protein